MKDLTQGSVTKHLLQMTAFLAISMAVQTLYLLADLYWVGHLGKEAIAAVGVAGNFTMIVLALTQMLGVGTTTLISQAAGRKDQSQAELAFNQSFVMSLIVAAGLGIFSFLLRDFYCESLSADAATASLAKSYLLVYTGASSSVSISSPRIGFARDGHYQADCQLPGSQCRPEYDPGTIADLWYWTLAQARRYRRRARYVYLHPRGRCFADTLFRKKLSLSPVPFRAVPSANQDVE